MSVAFHFGVNQADTTVPFGILLQDFVCAVCGAGVNAQDFDVLQTLAPDTFQAFSYVTAYIQ